MSDFSQTLQKASQYGLSSFLELMGELSQESIKKGALSRLQKEQITLGLALFKSCERCISIHALDAQKLGAEKTDLDLVKNVVLFLDASPHGEADLWDNWVSNWKNYSFSRKPERYQLRELIALAISIVMQHERQIECHMQAALSIGITREEIIEVLPIVMLMDGAPTLSQIPLVVKYAEKFTKDTA